MWPPRVLGDDDPPPEVAAARGANWLVASAVVLAISVGAAGGTQEARNALVGRQAGAFWTVGAVATGLVVMTAGLSMILRRRHLVRTARVWTALLGCGVWTVASITVMDDLGYLRERLLVLATGVALLVLCWTGIVLLRVPPRPRRRPETMTTATAAPGP